MGRPVARKAGRPKALHAGGYKDQDGRWVASSPEAQITPSISRVPGADHLKVRLGTGRMGAEKYGAPGGAPQAAQNLLALWVIEHLARELNVAEAEAKRLYYAVGRVMQRLLMEGRPCGIPHVGVLHIIEKSVKPEAQAKLTARAHQRARDIVAGRASRSRLGKRPEAAAAAAAKIAQFQASPIVRKIKFAQSFSLTRLFQDNMAYSGPWKLFLSEVRDRVSHEKGVEPKQHSRKVKFAYQGRRDKSGTIL